MATNTPKSTKSKDSGAVDIGLLLNTLIALRRECQATGRGCRARTWKDLTENVNMLTANLTGQVRNVAEVTTAVARGDLGKKITVVANRNFGTQEHHQHHGRSTMVVANGEVAELKDNVNEMIRNLRETTNQNSEGLAENQSGQVHPCVARPARPHHGVQNRDVRTGATGLGATRRAPWVSSATIELF